MSEIADIVATMAETGCTPDQIAAVVQVIERKKQDRRAKDRERQRRHRMSRDVTVTSRDVTNKEKEKSFTKKEKETLSPKEKPPKGGKKKRGSPCKRGQRLPPDWELPDDWGDWAVSEGMATDRVLLEEEKFRDYWHARAGPQGVKLDWQATWRNWVRRALESNIEYISR